MRRQPALRVTMRDVAERCGVSQMTVSRVLNGGPDVAPSTRARIELSIEELGYRPSALARGLVRQRSRMLGVITGGLRFSGVARTLTAISAEAELVGYGLLLRDVPSHEGADLSSAVEFMLDHQVEAIIVAAPDAVSRFDGRATRSALAGLPIVTLGSPVVRGVPSISIDNRGGAQAATRHLVDVGRRLIGHISGPPGWNEPSARTRGWREILRETGLVEAAEVAGNWSSVSGYRLLPELLAMCGDLDAVFCANDQMALGVLRRAGELGVRVPDDLAVMGFDDIPEACDFHPPLSTMRRDVERLGREAVRLTMRMLGGAPAAEPIVLEPTLVARESTLGRTAGPDAAPCHTPTHHG